MRVVQESAPQKAADLTQKVDELIAARLDDHQFLLELAALCDSRQESAWAVLARIDQSYRLGKLSPERFRRARLRIERRLLGLAEAESRGEPVATAPPAPPPALIGLPSPLPPAVTTTPTAMVPPAPESAPPELPPTAPFAIAVAASEAATSPPPPGAPALDPALRFLEMSDERGADRLTQEKLAAEVELPSAQLSVARGRKRALPLAALASALVVALVLLLLVMRAEQMEDPNRSAEPAAVAATTARTPEAKAAPSPGTIGFDADRYLVWPGESAATIRLVRTAGTDGIVTVDWWTVNGGARRGRDFAAPARQTVTFAEGEQELSLQVPILGNPRRRFTEFFTVRIGAPGGGATTAAITETTVFIMSR
jgi:hypothetical protein